MPETFSRRRQRWGPLALLLLCLMQQPWYLIAEDTVKPKYEGCYTQFGDQYPTWLSYGRLRVGQCIFDCKIISSAYAILRHTEGQLSECHCAPSISGLQKVSDATCSRSCPSDSFFYCGQGSHGGYISIYNTGGLFSMPSDEGCYKPSAQQFNGGPTEGFTHIGREGVGQCLMRCITSDRKYGILRYSQNSDNMSECYCSDDISGATLASGSCSRNCPSINYFTCGHDTDNSFASVYSFDMVVNG